MGIPSNDLRAAFDAFDHRRSGTLPVPTAVNVLVSLNVDATRQQLTTAVKDVAVAPPEGSTATATITYEEFEKVGAQFDVGHYSTEETFRGFSAVDTKNAARVSDESLQKAAASLPEYSEGDKRRLGSAEGYWAAYPERGMSLGEWRSMIGSLTPQLANKKATKM